MASAPLFCTHCGAANRVTAAFCFACGQVLHTSATEALLASTGVSTTTGAPTFDHLLKDRYRITCQLGKGGMGAVYKADDTLFNNRPVAVKEMSQGGLNSQQRGDAASDFKREAHMLADLRHASLPAIYDYFSDTGQWYLVMSFIEGETLLERLEREPGGWLPLKLGLAIGLQLCDVLAYLHTRQPPIIFRDLKPANLMLTSKDEIFLIDFGIARHFKPGQLKDTASFGSAGYAAPEQYGKSQTTPRSDIYSLGVLLHECLTGNDPASNSPTPFNFPPLDLHGQPHPPELEPLLMRMLEMLPDKRPASMTQVRQELERACASLTRLIARAARPVAPAPIPVQPASPAPSTKTAKPIEPATPAPSAPIVTHRSAKIAPIIYRGHSAAVTGVAWSSNGRFIASSSEDMTVRVWNTATNGLLYLPMHRHSGPVRGVAWSPDGRYGASCGQDGRVQVWNVDDGSHVYTYSGYSLVINALAWSPDSKRLALAKDSGRVQVLEATGGKSFEYTEHNSSVTCIAWSHDGQYIASGDKSGFIRIWYAHDGSEYGELTGHLQFGRSNALGALAWSPDDTALASGDQEGKIHVSSLPGRQLKFAYTRHFQAIKALAWSPDGMRVASASSDRSAHIWDARDGATITMYTQHALTVTSLAWSPTMNVIASGSEDRTVHIWSVQNT